MTGPMMFTFVAGIVLAVAALVLLALGLPFLPVAALAAVLLAADMVHIERKNRRALRRFRAAQTELARQEAEWRRLHGNGGASVRRDRV